MRKKLERLISEWTDHANQLWEDAGKILQDAGLGDFDNVSDALTKQARSLAIQSCIADLIRFTLSETVDASATPAEHRPSD